MMRLALLVSGGGTTANRIVEECLQGRLRSLVEPACLIASQPDIGAIDKWQATGVTAPAHVISRRDYKSAEAFGNALLDVLTDSEVDFVGQYGWTVKTPPNVIEAYRGWIVNQHPGPLDPSGIEGVAYPDFGGRGMIGLAVHQSVLCFAQGINRPLFWTEATTHHVTEEYDQGPVIARTMVEIKADDTAKSLQQRVLPHEHELQVSVVESYAQGFIPSSVRQVRLVKPDEIEVWQSARDEGMRLYPKG